MRTAVFVSVLLSIWITSALAGAHIEIDAPPKRDAAMKTPPCGGSGPRSATPKVFAPGETVTVKWHETVVHPGFFRVALSKDGTFPSDPPDPPPAAAGAVLAIVPKVDGTTEYSTDITLPDEPCETCTIQVIQYMRQHSPPPYYYQCADIAIRSSGVPVASDASTVPGNASNDPADDGGCVVSSSRPRKSAGAGLVAIAVVLAARRHRRRA